MTRGQSCWDLCSARGLSDEEIAGLNIPTGIPLVYELDDDLKPLSNRYLGDPEAARKAAEAVAKRLSADVETGLTEAEVAASRLESIDARRMFELKQDGFSDARLAALLGTREAEVRARRQAHDRLAGLGIG